MTSPLQPFFHSPSASIPVNRILSALSISFCLLLIAMTPAAAQSPKPGAGAPKTIGSIERLDPAFDKLVPQGAAIEVLGEGFDWAEGPCWIKDQGFLVFSDIPPNKIMKWDPKSGVSLFREK